MNFLSSSSRRASLSSSTKYSSASSRSHQHQDFPGRCHKSKSVVNDLTTAWSTSGLLTASINGRFNILAYELSLARLMELLQWGILGPVLKVAFDLIAGAIVPHPVDEDHDGVPVRPLDTIFRHEGIVLELDSHRVTITIELFDEGLDVATYYWQESREGAWRAAIKAMEERREEGTGGSPIVRMEHPRVIQEGFTGAALVELLHESIDHLMTTGYRVLSSNCQHLCKRLRRELAPVDLRPCIDGIASSSAYSTCSNDDDDDDDDFEYVMVEEQEDVADTKEPSK